MNLQRFQGLNAQLQPTFPNQGVLGALCQHFVAHVQHSFATLAEVARESTAITTIQSKE